MKQADRGDIFIRNVFTFSGLDGVIFPAERTFHNHRCEKFITYMMELVCAL
jgi:hypothetical protein